MCGKNLGVGRQGLSFLGKIFWDSGKKESEKKRKENGENEWWLMKGKGEAFNSCSSICFCFILFYFVLFIVLFLFYLFIILGEFIYLFIEAIILFILPMKDLILKVNIL